ncbi:MAG TPA: UDP-2,3-diacylglucosamine diphosphatase [Dokdonella sp.]|uniref:UDP-2,3-diacylglucosamine diphosphatase n=1 Tax=Dokdonella sp. TaxID=2291710 RepID=UPI002B660053|nr:UDP-2,3-diacylglucosamine diphosphatase [Dokdonella sp.]HUD42181.1 UDP-2,3-diacylglucosamine diphosphatase [Dokdonella sp.]
MATVFISDLHLDAARPGIIDLFADFIESQAKAVRALYILGDLFEAWIGDDDDDETGARVATVLSGLRRSGVPCFFIAGNRDFLLGDAWARRAGVTLLDDPSLIDVEGVPTLLMHGDTLCTDDARYQAIRTMLRARDWQRSFLEKPLAERRAFAAEARAESRRYTTDPANNAIMDVNEEQVRATLQRFGARRLIHGHTHRPCIHTFDLAGAPAQRIVLGDWYEQGSVLRIDSDAITLRALPAP